jgi:hypothetical protein
VPCGPAVSGRALAEGTTECARRVTADYRRQLDATLSQIDDLREGKRTEVRVVTVYKSTIEDDVDPSWGSPGAARVSVEGNNLFARARSARKRPRIEDCVPTSITA